MKTKFPATVMVFGVVSSEGHIMPPHIYEVYLDVLKSVVIPWWNQVAGGRPWVWYQDSAPAHNPKRPRLGFRRSATTLYLTSLGHTSRTSTTWPPTTPKPAWSPPSAEYSPSSHRRWWKRHSPSSGSVSRRWLRLKAVTLNRCQL